MENAQAPTQTVVDHGEQADRVPASARKFTAGQLTVTVADVLPLIQPLQETAIAAGQRPLDLRAEMIGHCRAWPADWLARAVDLVLDAHHAGHVRSIPATFAAAVRDGYTRFFPLEEPADGPSPWDDDPPPAPTAMSAPAVAPDTTELGKQLDWWIDGWVAEEEQLETELIAHMAIAQLPAKPAAVQVEVLLKVLRRHLPDRFDMVAEELAGRGFTIAAGAR